MYSLEERREGEGEEKKDGGNVNILRVLYIKGVWMWREDQKDKDMTLNKQEKNSKATKNYTLRYGWKIQLR